jgi:SRSO17 transposase
VDESGQEKTGQATVGVQRQYMGCTDRIANGVTTVYCSYAAPAGHALVAARIYVPAGQLADPTRRAACGIGEDVTFRTKSQLAIDICRDMLADDTMPPWAAGDEVYGRSDQLRTFLHDNGVGYVMRVGCAFHVDVSAGVRIRADQAVARFVTTHAWQARVGPRHGTFPRACSAGVGRRVPTTV